MKYKIEISIINEVEAKNKKEAVEKFFAKMDCIYDSDSGMINNNLIVKEVC